MLMILKEKAERIVYGQRTNHMQATSQEPDTEAEFLDTVPPDHIETEAENIKTSDQIKIS